MNSKATAFLRYGILSRELRCDEADLGNEPVPDETAIRKFRHPLKIHKLERVSSRR